MKIIFLISFIILAIIIGGFTYMKLNPIVPIKPFVEKHVEEIKPIEKTVIPKKVKKKIKQQQKKSHTIYHCDKRIWCSQMHSCEEAKFFIRNCRGTKMDGDGDGIPCERQWCH